MKSKSKSNILANHSGHHFHLFVLLVLALLSCRYQKTLEKDKREEGKRIVSDEQYRWPSNQRSHWPTVDWAAEDPISHGLDLKVLRQADSLASTDDAFRSLLIIKHGYLVFEKYYHEGSKYESSEVWSVTKSITSALLGIVIDQNYIRSIDEKMVDYLPDYPGFHGITVRHVLTHSTGLNWDEGNQSQWIKSADWTKEALNRGFFSTPGENFLYSSANSHFLSHLIQRVTGKTPGMYALEKLFGPLGINFIPTDRRKLYQDWTELHEPIPGSWRQDNQGLEIGAFGLHLTAREMAKFGFLYINRGKWAGQRIISEKWIKESTSRHILRSDNKGFGLHWVVSKRKDQSCIEADGWGGQMISILPSLDMIIVIKCDPIEPRDNQSYRVLEMAIESAASSL